MVSSDSSKKRTNKFFLLLWRLVFVRFLEEIEDTKNHFEIIWPLEIKQVLSPRIWDVEAFWYKTEIKIVYFVLLCLIIWHTLTLSFLYLKLKKHLVFFSGVRGHSTTTWTEFDHLELFWSYVISKIEHVSNIAMMLRILWNIQMRFFVIIALFLRQLAEDAYFSYRPCNQNPYLGYRKLGSHKFNQELSKTLPVCFTLQWL